jgi:hypothetical protein
MPNSSVIACIRPVSVCYQTVEQIVVQLSPDF